MAGLSMAWLAHKAGRDVVVFEASPKRGMDAHRLKLVAAGSMFLCA